MGGGDCSDGDKSLKDGGCLASGSCKWANDEEEFGILISLNRYGKLSIRINEVKVGKRRISPTKQPLTNGCQDEDSKSIHSLPSL